MDSRYKEHRHNEASPQQNNFHGPKSQISPVSHMLLQPRNNKAPLQQAHLSAPEDLPTTRVYCTYNNNKPTTTTW